MFAQWDDHEVTNDWSPAGSYDESGYDEHGNSRLVARARRAFLDYMPIRETRAQEGRVYRRIGYGPLLDVFMIDMRSYRDSSWNKGGDRDSLHSRRRAAHLAEARACGVERDLEGDRRRPADRADQPRCGRARRRAARAARARDRRSPVLPEARRRPQYRVAHRRHALHRRASLRSVPRGVYRFRAVLGVRLRPAACRHLGAGKARQYLRPGGDVPERLQRGAGRKSCALLRPAILRPRRYRRPIGRDDGDAEGCRRPRPLVGRHRAAPSAGLRPAVAQRVTGAADHQHDVHREPSAPWRSRAILAPAIVVRPPCHQLDLDCRNNNCAFCGFARVRQAAAVSSRSYHGSIFKPRAFSCRGSGSAPFACRAMSAAPRSRARSRSAIATSTPPRCTPMRTRSAPRSPPPA